MGDPRHADQNGAMLGLHAVAAVSALPTAGAETIYAGTVVSGATLGTWEERAIIPAERSAVSLVSHAALRVELPLRPQVRRRSAQAAPHATDQRQATSHPPRTERRPQRMNLNPEWT